VTLSQEQIVNAYVRWKTRSWILTILHTWRHQALFGRVVGMYPRKKLLKCLSDQKSHAIGLQKRISGETVVLEELHGSLTKEINRTRELETRYTLLGLDVNRQRMIVHHADQEIARLHAIIEVCLFWPTTTHNLLVISNFGGSVGNFSYQSKPGGAFKASGSLISVQGGINAVCVNENRRRCFGGSRHREYC
jgi:hypothetical protein